MKYVATKRSSITDKMRLYASFYNFVNGDFDEKLFSKWLYRRLSSMFGLSQHFNRVSFYSHWFTTDNRRYSFLKKILEWDPKGDPRKTFSDVETEIQAMLSKSTFMSLYLDKAVAEYNSGKAGDHLLVPETMKRKHV